MSLSTALSIALSGIQATQIQLQLASNNIANAQSAGYTEKSATLNSVALGGVTGGVSVTGYTRATNTALTQSYNQSTSNASMLSTQNNYLSDVQTILNSTSNNPALSDAIAQFSSAWTQLSAQPENTTQQQAVIQAGVNLANQVNSIASQVHALNVQVQNDTSATVKTLNAALQQVTSLNQQISTAIASQQPTDDLEDQRDQAINAVAAITGVTVMQRPQDGVALYTPNGVLLLDGTARTFSYDAGTGKITDDVGSNVTSGLVGGTLQAEIQFAATAPGNPSSSPAVNVIQKLNAQLTDLVQAFTQSTNTSGATTFEAAYNPGGTGDDFFTATGNDPSTFSVNANLLNGTDTIPEDNVENVATTFGSNFNFSDASAGLTLGSGTYADLGTAILSNFQQAANSISAQSTSAAQQQTYFKTALSSATGVNVDTELVNLTTLQNSYAATAHVISTISEMFNELVSILP